MEEHFDKVVLALEEHDEYGLTLTELITISGLSHSIIISMFELLEDSDRLYVKSDGVSRIYKLRN